MNRATPVNGDVPRVCVVTVTYGSRAGLCRETVRRALAAGAAHVILVDNGSRERDELARWFDLDDDVTLVSTGQNLGSAGGFAAGINAATQRTEDYVLLLDDDNRLSSDSLSTAVEFHRSLEGLGDDRLVVACMRVSNPLHRAVAQGRPVRQVYPPAGSFLSLDLLQRIHRAMSRRRHGDLGCEGPPVIPVAPYGGLLLRRSALARAGGPDPLLTLYEDDTAWTSRLTNCGYRIVLCVDAKIDDAEGKWLDQAGRARGPLRMLRADSETRLYYSIRNRVLFDSGRAKGLGLRWRYGMNRCAFLLYVRIVATSAGTARARRVLLAAVKDGEAGRLDRGPNL